MTAGTTALWIAAGFALLSVAASLREGSSAPTSSTPLRALVMATVFAATALALLLLALWQADLSVDFVVRHTMLGLPKGVRAVAVFANPAGVGLVIAMVLGVCSAWVGRRGDNRGVVAVAAMTMLVLLAAPLAGGSMARLPWTPLDGQSAAPFFREVMSIPYVGFQTVGVVAAATTLGCHLQAWWGDSERAPKAEALGRLAVCCLGWQAMAHTAAALAAGLSSGVQPFLAGGGRFGLAVLVAGVAHFIGRAPLAPPQSKVEGWLGASLAAVSLALAPAGVVVPSPAVRFLGLLGGGVVLVGAWRARNGLRVSAGEAWRDGRLHGGVRLVPLAALGFGLAAALSGLWSRGTEVILESGGRAPLGDGTELVHLGVSRYDREGADVLALAVERHAGGQSRLASAELREYLDARGSVVPPLAIIPAVLRTAWGPLYVWLKEVEANDRVRLRIALAPGLWLAWVAVVLSTLWVVWPPTAAQGRARPWSSPAAD